MKSKPKAIQGWTSIYKKKPNSYFPSLITSHFIKSTLYKIVGTKITCTSWMLWCVIIENLIWLWKLSFFFTWIGVRHGCDLVVVGFTTACAINAYHHLSCEFESCSWRGVLDTCTLHTSHYATRKLLNVLNLSSLLTVAYILPKKINC
jgi:hypothetical protein